MLPTQRGGSGLAARCRRRKAPMRIRLLLLSAALAAVALYGTLTVPWPTSTPSSGIQLHRGQQHPGSRSLLSASEVSAAVGSRGGPELTEQEKADRDLANYPPELFTVEQWKKGAVVLHTLGVLYMFVGLAIVCDELFCPALEVMSEALEISDDVAAATAMAAGGSMPEFFTSLIGVFIAESDVGIGTTVGSAVFNLLFVIGMCAIFSREVLALTWWPLARDCSFYIIGLSFLAYFFSDNKVEWFEALILILIYFSYVFFMKFNQVAERWVKAKLGLLPAEDEGGEEDDSDGNGESRAHEHTEPEHHVAVNTFRLGALSMMLKNVDPKGHGPRADRDTRFSRAADILVKSEIHGSHGNSSSPSPPSARPPLPPLPNLGPSAAAPGSTKGISSPPRPSGSGEPRWSAPGGAGARPPLPAAKAFHIGVDDQPPTPAEQNSQIADIPSLTSTPTETVGGGVRRRQSIDVERQGRGDHGVGEDEIGSRGKHGSRGNGGGRGGDNGSGGVTADTAIATASTAAVDGNGGDGNGDGDDDDDDGAFNLEWPDNTRARIIFVLLFPITFSLWLTVPNCAMPGKRKYWPVTFAMSLFWITVFSYWMVFFATVIGLAAKIPPPIMGLTLLAAGTSVPDLFSSVVVARKGMGDAAVSSSVGSNLFDICVGLPVPWLLYSAIYGGASNPVRSDALGTMILLLLLLIVAVITSIALSGWKMTKLLGGVMFFLYGVFMLIALLLEYDEIKSF